MLSKETYQMIQDSGWRELPYDERYVDSWSDVRCFQHKETGYTIIMDCSGESCRDIKQTLDYALADRGFLIQKE